MAEKSRGQVLFISGGGRQENWGDKKFCINANAERSNPQNLFIKKVEQANSLNPPTYVVDLSLALVMPSK